MKAPRLQWLRPFRSIHPGLAPTMLVGFALVLTACEGRGPGELAPGATGGQQLRVAGASSGGGAADGVALALLQSVGTLAGDPTGRQVGLADGTLSSHLRHMVCTHLLFKSFGLGSADVAGSSRTKRLARTVQVADNNRNGTILDEVLTTDLMGLAKLAGTPFLPPRLGSALFPWRDGTADFSQPIDATQTPLGIPVVETAAGQVDMRQVGDAMMARLLFAGDLVAYTRGNLIGRNGLEGGFGLMLLQQVAAMEETLLRELFFDGRFLGGLSAASTYDPSSSQQKPAWLPASFQVQGDPTAPRIATSYSLLDRASSLAAAASILRAASQLSYVASTRFPQQKTTALFAGEPFGFSTRNSGNGDPDPNAPTVGFENHVQKIFTARCTSCHGGSFPRAGLVLTSFESTMKGGSNSGSTSSTPIVVPKNAKASLLYQVLLGDTTVARQMPQFSSLDAADIKVIETWINQGAHKSVAEPPDPVKTGKDLARVMLANVRALHLGKDGALHHRYDGDMRSDYMEAESTGLLLLALSHAAAAIPDDKGYRELLAEVAPAAASRLLDRDGRVAEGYALDAERPTGAGDVRHQAAITAGLLAAAHTLDDSDLRRAGRSAARVLLEQFYDPSVQLFRTYPGEVAVSYSPETLQSILEALREAAIDNDPAQTVTSRKARIVHEAFLLRLQPYLAFAEDTGAEVQGDGQADTDANGLKEPALAGGAYGRAPLLAGAWRYGPDSNPAGSSQRPVTWSQDIQPLFQSKCAECHMNGASLGSYRLDSPTLAGTAGDSGGTLSLIVPGNAGRSLLYTKVRDRTPPIGVQMPQARPPLDAYGIELLRRWIDEGATRR